MSKKTIIKVATESLPINLGVNYFYKFFYETTGVDLIATPKIEGVEGVKMFYYAAAFISAGYKAHCKIEGQEEKVSHETIEHLINSMDLTEAALIVEQLLNIINGEAKEEKPSKKKKIAG